jgi:hypothetical protein
MHAKPTPAPVAEDKILEVEISEMTDFGKEKYLRWVITCYLHLFSAGY